MTQTARTRGRSGAKQSRGVAPRTSPTLPTAVSVTLGSHDLPRGTTTVWDTNPDGVGSPLATPALLLHGWNVDAPLTFGSTITNLATDRRVIMFDHHGHGSGARRSDAFRIDDCATDALRVLDALNIEKAIIVGYSLGGAVAQILGRFHPSRCQGIVLAATADTFSEGPLDVAQFAGLHACARTMRRLPTPAQRAILHTVSAIGARRYPRHILDTVRQADPTSLLEAGAALGRFESSEWLTHIEVPSAVVVTAADSVVPPERQRRLARLLNTSHIFEVDAGHDVPVRDDPRLSEALTQAVCVVDADRNRQDAQAYRRTS